MRKSIKGKVVSSRNIEAIIRKPMERPLSEGIIIRVKTRTDKSYFKPVSGVPFTRIETYHCSSLTTAIISSRPIISVVVGRLHFNTHSSIQGSDAHEIKLLSQQQRIQRLLRKTHRQLVTELPLASNAEEYRRKSEIINNLESFTLGDETTKIGIPIPSYAISFSESVRWVSRVAGLFVFGANEQQGYEFIPLGRGRTIVESDLDGSPFFNFRTMAFVKFESNKPVEASGKIKQFLAEAGLNPTLADIVLLDKLKENWREEAPEEVEEEIDRIALRNNVMLIPRRQTLTSIPVLIMMTDHDDGAAAIEDQPIACSDEQTRVEIPLHAASKIPSRPPPGAEDKEVSSVNIAHAPAEETNPNIKKPRI